MYVEDKIELTYLWIAIITMAIAFACMSAGCTFMTILFGSIAVALQL